MENSKQSGLTEPAFAPLASLACRLCRDADVHADPGIAFAEEGGIAAPGAAEGGRREALEHAFNAQRTGAASSRGVGCREDLGDGGCAVMNRCKNLGFGDLEAMADDKSRRG